MVAFNISVSNSVPVTSAPATPAQLEARHDAMLVRRFNRGEEGAFTEIADRYHDKMLAVAFGRLRNYADAEEIAQDTLLRAHRALANFRGESSLSTWLHRIAVNLSLNRYWYFFRRRRHLMTSFDRPLNEDTSTTLKDILASDAPSPAGDVITGELTQLIADCMEQLGPRHREILHLRNTLDRSYEEISGSLGIGLGTVKSRIARARQSLRTLMNISSPDALGDPQALDARDESD